jgi:hypothetical protein
VRGSEEWKAGVSEVGVIDEEGASESEGAGSLLVLSWELTNGG